MDTLFALAVVITILFLIVMTIMRGFLRSGAGDLHVQKLDSRARHRPVPANPYRAVTVCAVSGGCEAVKRMSEHRFLVNEAPLLPLPGCTAERCNCKYVRHQDRRDPEHERRGLQQASTELYPSEGHNDRRSKRGRRKADWVMA